MPYIDRGTATILEKRKRKPTSPGELNFMISRLLSEYVQTNGLSYQSINDISGATTEALAEFRRRIVVDYEGLKIANGGADPYLPVQKQLVEHPQAWVNRVNTP